MCVKYHTHVSCVCKARELHMCNSTHTRNSRFKRELHMCNYRELHVCVELHMCNSLALHMWCITHTCVTPHIQRDRRMCGVTHVSVTHHTHVCTPRFICHMSHTCHTHVTHMCDIPLVWVPESRFSVDLHIWFEDLLMWFVTQRLHVPRLLYVCVDASFARVMTLRWPIHIIWVVTPLYI